VSDIGEVGEKTGEIASNRFGGRVTAPAVLSKIESTPSIALPLMPCNELSVTEICNKNI
jgi:hypothetical protein